MLFSRACENIAINVLTTRERAGGIYTREARVFIKLAENEKCGKTRVASMRAID